MPLTNLSDIEKQEKLFQQHISDFIKPRTENSTHPKECIELLRFRFSEKLGLSPRVNFFAFNSVKELREKRKEIEKIPNYEAVDKKINRYQPRAALNAYEKFLIRFGTDAGLYAEESDEDLSDEIIDVLQKIFFGAPGTGKSHKLDYDLFKDVNGKPLGKGLKSVSNDSKFRTTFHPDYDYAQFVGSYKPKKDGSSITYSFVPQVFAKAYVAAWREHLIAEKSEDAKSVYLVIEEINRGNCAQIFGDIFQLLDRKNGWSEYPIDVDSDFASYIREKMKALEKFAEYRESIYKSMDDSAEAKILSDDEFCKITLPPNFNILATMNTSDQSLFPMDSAFKRRFDWEYVPIQYKNPYNAEKEKEAHDKWLADKFVIDLGLKENNPKWLHFLKKVNADIYKVTQSEDKQMGEFFVKSKDGVIDLNMFRSKVLFYLWDSVYKDEVDQKTMFHFKHPEGNGSEVTFQSLFGEDAKAIEIIKKMMENLDAAYESKEGSEFKDFKILT